MRYSFLQNGGKSKGAWLLSLSAFFAAIASISNDLAFGQAQKETPRSHSQIEVEALPRLPDRIGVAGPIVGVHEGAVIVAGGANFAVADDANLWTLPKKFHRAGWVLTKQDGEFQWDDKQKFQLPYAIGYSAVVSSPMGVIAIGGNDEKGPTNRTLLLRRVKDAKGRWKIQCDEGTIPDLPVACSEAGAAILRQGKTRFVYLFGGKVAKGGGKLEPSGNLWRLNLDDVEADQRNHTRNAKWVQLARVPVSARVFPLVAAQHDGFNDRLYILGGRCFKKGSDSSDLTNLEFFDDGWSYNPAKDVKIEIDEDAKDPPKEEFPGWEKVAKLPRKFSAGTAVDFGQSHILVLAYADGSVIRQFLDAKEKAAKQGNPAFDWKDFEHPGFPKTAYAYHTLTDTWASVGEMPVGQVTTPATKLDGEILLVSGEIRPRVRTNQVWKIKLPVKQHSFGTINMVVLFTYLLAVVGVGVFFTIKNKSTDDYFRGGKNIHWFVAGCSIYATMLSSITYMAIPAKAYAQDWVYAFGMLLILAVAPIAVYVALPFFRRLDATSAYEYLEKRFNRVVRWVGSASFTLFHIFRMGVVMALAALALASVTPMTPTTCVLVMGLLSIIYCTLGGIEAVVWTDTVQTFVLLGGAVFCALFAWMGSDPGSFQAASNTGKFHFVNLDFNPFNLTTMTILVVVVGGFGQNIASYTADQAVVQRYMTTRDSSRAARSIWFNGWMALPSGIIFFGLGTLFWMFYRSNPEKIDPAIATDRIMPLFISQELPVGIAGLVVAGIFAAAQSTVSTSMNSGASTIVSDFLRPLRVFGNAKESNEKRYLRAAQGITLLMGVLGTAAGLLFVNPNIKSLFDEFIGILGLFMGVLAGLFVLGATTKKANAWGGLVGAGFSLLVMSLIFLASKEATLFGVEFLPIAKAIFPFPFEFYKMNGYLYAFSGIIVCVGVGYVFSFVLPGSNKSIEGLTLWNRKAGAIE